MSNFEKENINANNTRIANLFTRVSYKLNFSNKKNNQLLFSLDLLKDKTKIDLLFIVAKNLETTYTDIYQQPNPISLMETNGEVIFVRLLEESCEEYLMTQYGCQIKVKPCGCHCTQKMCSKILKYFLSFPFMHF